MAEVGLKSAENLEAEENCAMMSLCKMLRKQSKTRNAVRQNIRGSRAGPTIKRLIEALKTFPSLKGIVVHNARKEKPSERKETVMLKCQVIRISKGSV
jgi:hypothetical protein